MTAAIGKPRRTGNGGCGTRNANGTAPLSFPEPLSIGTSNNVDDFLTRFALLFEEGLSLIGMIERIAAKKGTGRPG